MHSAVRARFFWLNCIFRGSLAVSCPLLKGTLCNDLICRRIGETHSADDFYCRMSELMQSALNGRLINGNELTRLAYRVASFPFPHLNQLREKYTYNITPFAAENHDELRESDYR